MQIVIPGSQVVLEQTPTKCGRGFGIGNWVEAGRIFKVHDRKSLPCLEEAVRRNRDIRGDLLSAEKEVKRVLEKAFIALENTCIAVHRVLLETEMLKEEMKTGYWKLEER